MGIKAGDRVLEVGVGTGINLSLYPARGARSPGSTSPPSMLEKARERAAREERRPVRLLQMDAADLKFARRLVRHRLRAVPHQRGARSGQGRAGDARVCRPGGRVIILNHFLSPNRFLSRIERLISPATIHIGFKADLDLPAFLAQAELQPVSIEKVNWPRIWSLVTVRQVAPRRASPTTPTAGEELRPVLGDVQVVLEAHAELPANIDPGLVAERSCCGCSVSAFSQPNMLFFTRYGHSWPSMPMPWPTRWREVLEAGTVAGVGDHLARGGVERLERHAGLRGLAASRSARCLTMSKTVFILSVGLPSTNVRVMSGLVALDRAAAVDHDDRALADRLRLDRAVRERGVFADLHAGAAGKPRRSCACVDEAADRVLRHARLQRAVRPLRSLQRHLRREPHQLDLVRLLDHPAAGDDRRGADQLRAAARPARRCRSTRTWSSPRCRARRWRRRDPSARCATSA